MAGSLGTESAADAVAELFRPAGHALGIVSCGAVSPLIKALLSTTLEAHSLAPARRLALLQPRIGETQVRTSDAVEFLDHYGHEYALAWISLTSEDTSGNSAGALAGAARAEGARVVIDATEASSTPPGVRSAADLVVRVTSDDGVVVDDEPANPD